MTSLWPVHDLLMTCSWFVYDLLMTCSWHIQNLLMPCSLLVNDLFMTSNCSLFVHYLLMTCSWLITCSWLVHVLLTTFLYFLHNLFMTCLQQLVLSLSKSELSTAQPQLVLVNCLCFWTWLVNSRLTVSAWLSPSLFFLESLQSVWCWVDMKNKT